MVAAHSEPLATARRFDNRSHRLGLWFDCNHPPVGRGSVIALRENIQNVGFTTVVPYDSRSQKLDAKRSRVGKANLRTVFSR